MHSTDDGLYRQADRARLAGRLAHFLLLVALAVPAHAAPDDLTAAGRIVHQNFQYRAETGDGAEVHTGAQPFSGDCDDFALAAAYQLWVRGHDPELVFLRQRQGNHIITCLDGWCVDNQKKRPYRERRAEGTVLARRPLSSDRALVARFEGLVVDGG